jgi:hypothetical protein
VTAFCVVPLSVLQLRNVYCGTSGDELKRIWKETVTTGAPSCICLVGLTKTIEHLILTGGAPCAVKTGHVTDTLGRWCTA